MKKIKLKIKTKKKIKLKRNENKIQQKTYRGPKLTLNCQKLKLKKGTN